MTDKPGLQEGMFEQLRTKELFDQASTFAYDYMNGVRERNVFPSEAALKDMALFDETLPASPGDPGAILRMLHLHGSPATVAETGGRYFGFVTGGALPSALAAKWLADVWDQNTPMFATSPISAHLEEVCERWLVDLLGLPAGTAAGFVSGSSMATLSGLAAGRNELLRRRGWDVNADGLFGAPNLRVVVSEQAHGSVFKALSMLGLGRARVEAVPADDQGRMRLDQLPALDGDCLVIAQAGNVNSGAFDDFEEIGKRARLAQAWLHVDGAFGLWAAASRNRKALTRGIELADSWSVDAHKTLNAPYDSGIVLCRLREALVTAMQSTGSYLQHSSTRDGMNYAPELSRRARAIELWVTLKTLGKEGTEELVDRLCDLAARFAYGLRVRGFRILNDVVFNQVLVACDTPAETQATLARIQASGECWCGGAQWQGEPVIRISVCSWATTAADVDRSVAAFIASRDAARVSLIKT